MTLNMKRIFILLSIAALSLTACDSYLDRQPDDALTSDTIWEKRNTTMQYLWNVYSWIPNDADPCSNNDAFDACVSDETSGSFPNSRFGRYMFETQTPDDTYTSTKYRNMYYGIREAGIFMENVDRCPELTAEQIKEYKAEARFLRAYYYFYIMKNYGPTFFNGETSYETLDKDVNEVDRTAWQPLVDWVCGQLDQAAADLPDARDASSAVPRRVPPLPSRPVSFSTAPVLFSTVRSTSAKTVRSLLPICTTASRTVTASSSSTPPMMRAVGKWPRRPRRP